jgi:hypothetical protein
MLVWLGIGPSEPLRRKRSAAEKTNDVETI